MGKKHLKLLIHTLAALMIANTLVVSTPAYAGSLSGNTVIATNPFVDYSKLDTGLYWFDKNNKPYRDKASDSPFDINKPTLIYVHGWMPNNAQKSYLSDFMLITDADTHVEKNSVKKWIEDGYNVGVFNWCQLSDEPEVKNAEAKIWTTNYTWDGWFSNELVGMRWKDNKGNFHTDNKPTVTSAELFYNAYKKAMKGFKGDEIRIVGHSLGNQMAIRLMDLIDKGVDRGDLAPELIPERVALLDPYYSYSSKNYLNGSTTGEEAAKIVERLIKKDNIAFEMYKSSTLTNGTISGDANVKLENLCYKVDLYPWYYWFYQQSEKHSIPTSLYFWSKELPKENNPYVVDNATIGARMGASLYWYQKSGHYTIDPSDDVFLPYKKTDSPYVPQKDIALYVDGKKINNATLDNCETISLKKGEYLTINSQVSPANATSKIVSFDKVGGEKNSLQLATNGKLKGLNNGTTVLKVHSRNLDANGNLGNTIEKYVKINVE